MSINPYCEVCKKQLRTFGAILLSPPNKRGFVIKHHLCKSCYKNIVKSNNIKTK